MSADNDAMIAERDGPRPEGCRFGLASEAGYAADVVVVDLSTITDTATYEDPVGLARGVSHVVVNGRLASGRPSDQRKGWPGHPEGGLPRIMSLGWVNPRTSILRFGA